MSTIRTSRIRPILLSMAFLFSTCLPALATPSSASTITITAPGPGGAILAEMDEFASQVLGDAWDMNEPADLAFYRRESNIANGVFANGMYAGTMTAGDGRERITLLAAGSQGGVALRVGKLGYNYPINADYYRYLTFRMYSSNTNCNSAILQWFSDDSYSFAAQGISNGILVPPLPCTNQRPGWYTYVVDLRQIGIQSSMGSRAWSGTIRELILHPYAGAGAAGSTVKLDWARLTSADPRTARPYTIRWTGSASSPLAIYASPGNQTLDENDILVAEGVSPAAGSYTFQTGVLPPGDYYFAIASREGNTTELRWSQGALVINRPPRTTVQRPSMTDGQEYSATQLGNAWDMSDAADVNYNLPAGARTCLINEVFSGGLYHATIPQPLCGSRELAL